jgi:hypothetical protein
MMSRARPKIRCASIERTECSAVKRSHHAAALYTSKLKLLWITMRRHRNPPVGES